ncbi:MAG: GntR family transcriptional regulator, transcriptional repressor for pyruvate dehydrogenase complex [Solirubrobacteraceae bacterium]|jgi:DNA-binding FadR family transcriptional regulator|nr:GntR family transcriptional regulator, transcriptional repressor for pyruvate dehydrogenase complex [Solirubrobacteraceae bacterium]
MAVDPPSLLASRVPRAEGMARDLEAQILGGGLAPGDRLGTKDDLRQRFGVAVATVNEAVRLLEVRGLIEARPGPGGGVFVANSSVRVALKRSGLQATWGAARFADCLAVRNGLEPLVCRDAAANRTAEDIAALRELVTAMERHAADPDAYFELNWGLHRRIARGCRNAPLHSIYLTLIDFLEDGLRPADLREFRPEADVAIHRELIDAIEEGPGPGLDAAVERHLAIPTALRNPHSRSRSAARPARGA